ncbi:MAG: hypothetical protein FJ303_24625 [Planctomycetes bacterium]|nr:hypothetical protein [Planctomycetota bacterium]
MTNWFDWRGWLQAIWPMVNPLLLGAAVFLFMYRQQDESVYDEQAIKEWVREARIGSRSLPEMINDFFTDAEKTREKLHKKEESIQGLRTHHAQKRAEIQEFLESLCLPPTKIYPNQLPLFPVIYRLEVIFDDDVRRDYEPLSFEPIYWDSDSPRHANQFRDLEACELTRDQKVKIRVQYHLHAYMQKQFKEREADANRRLINTWVLFFVVVVVLWMLIIQRNEAERERQRLLAEQEVQESKQKSLEGELRRQEAERKQEEAEKKHLQEELRRQQAEREKQEVERQALELKSQMFHSIGIMAKSYAHNIKNLLVRPNDLLRRCLEEHPSPEESARMLQEIQQILTTVTERLQEILQTVQRDPNKFERVQIDVNLLARDLFQTWAEQAESKWKMVIELDLHGTLPSGDVTPLFVSGDRSHLQQTLENFLFNARDAIAEMRNHLRKQARPDGAAGALDETHRQALIAAAGWKGHVVIRTRIVDGQPIIEIRDNGIGMTEETRLHCTEPHFSTKRQNALYAGMSSGLGLGLSFVQMILQHHGATLEIESAPQKGALFRVRFPLAPESSAPAASVKK